MSILILNGANLNMLGKREEGIYGNSTLENAIDPCRKLCKQHNINFQHFQSNNEGDIINFLHKNTEQFQFIIANLGAFTHTSIAIRDAILSIQNEGKPQIIELHISNTHKREEFRHKSFISDISHGIITGFGIEGYLLATKFAIYKIINDSNLFPL